MKTSREQFEEWYSNRYGIPDFSKALEHAKSADAFEVWQASRQCIEVDTPWLCGDAENDDSEYTQGYNAGIIATQNRIVKAGIKVKGA